MSFDPIDLFLGFIFSSIGLGYFIYGKKQKILMPMLVGVSLMAYTFFVPNRIAIVVIGVILSVIPYFFRNY
jgi:hypothetical protein